MQKRLKFDEFDVFFSISLHWFTKFYRSFTRFLLPRVNRHSKMDASDSKLAMYVVPTQFGKTFACIQTIKQSPPETLHVVFTMNTLMGKDQFTSRVVTEIEAAYGADAVCCVASKKSNVCRRRFRNTEELGDEIALSMIKRKAPIRVVVMCSHGKRFQEAPEFIADVMKIMSDVVPEKRQKLQLYFDEIHHYANEKNPGGRRVRSLIEAACESDLVKKVYGYTATPNAVWGDGMWESIVIDNVDYNDENYVGVSDLDWVKCPSTALPAEFAAEVYDAHPRVFGHMARVFVPGYRNRDTHYAVRDTLQEKDPEIVVVVLNGENKRIYYYENPEDHAHEPKSIELIPEGMEEVCETISRILIKEKLLERPIVWTGNICVSMGQTLAHESVGAFTSVLINTHAMEASALYQLLGRATGRYLGWGIDMYPTVYSPIEVKDVCEELEYAAKKLANDFSGQEVTQDMYSIMCPTAFPQKRVKKNKGCDDDWDLIEAEFDTQEEANALLSSVPGCRRKLGKLQTNESGFVKSSTTGKLSVLPYNDVKSKLAGMSKTSMFDSDPDKKESGAGYGRMIICYRDVNDIETCVFIVRILKKK